MQRPPNGRQSCADFDGRRRYMLVIGTNRIDVSVDRDFQMDVSSNFHKKLRLVAERWIRDTARDIAAAYGGSELALYHMIKEAI